MNWRLITCRGFSVWKSIRLDEWSKKGPGGFEACWGPYLLISLFPYLLISLSPYLLISLSPYLLLLSLPRSDIVIYPWNIEFECSRVSIIECVHFWRLTLTFVAWQVSSEYWKGKCNDIVLAAKAAKEQKAVDEAAKAADAGSSQPEQDQCGSGTSSPLRISPDAEGGTESKSSSPKMFHSGRMNSNLSHYPYP